MAGFFPCVPAVIDCGTLCKWFVPLHCEFNVRSETLTAVWNYLFCPGSKQGKTLEVRVGGSIRRFFDVSEVSKDCNLTFGHSFPGVVLYSNWK